MFTEVIDIQTDVTNYLVKLGSVELKPESGLVSVVVQHSFNVISSAEITLLDDAIEDEIFPLSNEEYSKPGTTVEISSGYHDDLKVIFIGVVVNQQLKIKHGRSLLILYCKHEAITMTLSRCSRYFVEVADSDIWSLLSAKYGIGLEADTSNVLHKQMVQCDSTDWDFMVTRAEANGMLVSTINGGIKILKPDAILGVGGLPPLPGVGFTATLGANLFELEADIEARHQPEAVLAKAWDAGNNQVPEERSTEPALTQPGNLDGTALAGALGNASQTYIHAAALPGTELKAWADALMLRARLASMRGRMRIQGQASLLPGDTVTLAGVGPRFEGPVMATGIRHEIARGNWLTDVQFGLSADLFISKLGQQQPATALLPSVSGLVTAVVSDIDDPLKECRIKIRIPVWDNQEEGIWARYLSTDAGTNRGMIFMPEVGDEVLVGFLNDDPRHPVVLGGLYSAHHSPPFATDADNKEKGWVTRSGIKMILNDEDKSLHISTPGGHSIYINEADKSIAIKCLNGNVVTLNEEGVAIESVKNITLKATNDITLDAINIKAKASAQLGMEGSSGTEIKSSATTTIKGSMVMIN